MSEATNLQAAHRGYHYQDLAAAVAMAELLVAGHGSITVDLKEFEGDMFDDIVIESPEARERRQLKWTDSELRFLNEADFRQGSSDVCITKLISSFLQAKRTGLRDVVRLAVRWQRPNDAKFLSLLELDTSTSSIFPTTTTCIYRLKADRIWPVGGNPRWNVLLGSDRAAFVDFAEHFVIETELPPCSRDLMQPGDLEEILITVLREKIGIGVYPNHRRRVPDVAALLVTFAVQARARSAKVTGHEIARAMALETDFGAIAQRFPVRTAHSVKRQALREMLCTSIRSNRITELIGSPGTGKSWELTLLAEDLRSQGVVVATHYCYVEPADEHVHRRITIDTMCGNLISALINESPDLLRAKDQRFAATTAELQRVLSEAGKQAVNHPIVIIVDGLDHIDRIMAESRHIAPLETSIVEELAALSWPTGISLVVGSQPGSHLAPLLDMACQLEMPDMTIEETADLVSRLGCDDMVAAAIEPREEVIRLLHDRSEGNALYTTMLLRGAFSAASRGQSLIDYVRESPVIDGQVSQYYSYLYNRLRGGKPIADLLGVLDFAVTEIELASLVGPLLSTWISESLSELRPLLNDITGQGGIRVFHESFRRFIVERKGPAACRLPTLLAPVIDWLCGRGFFNDTRAYRYLPMCYGRAARYDELFSLLGPDFITRSIEHGRPREDVERSLRYACVIAANTSRFADLARCAQLLRTCSTCFSEHMSDPEHYWRTYLHLFGPQATAERIVLHGRAVIGQYVGLRICSIIDDSGGIAPWETYLDLPSVISDQDKGDERVAETLSAMLHGKFMTEGVEYASNWATRLLEGRAETAGVAEACSIAARWARFDANAVLGLVKSATTPVRLRSAIALAAAEALVDEGSDDIKTRLLSLARETAKDLEAVHQCLLAGCIPELKSWNVYPEKIDRRELHPRGLQDEMPTIDRWFAEVAVVAFVSPDRLSKIRKTIDENGWYWSWLRFCTVVCEAEAIIATSALGAVKASGLVSQAFRELAQTATPFDGNPRAIDLYGMRSRIAATVRRGLACLELDHFEDASAALLEAARGTNGYFRGFSGGPLPWATVLELLLPFSANPATRDVAVRRALEVRQLSLQEGQLYPMEGEIELCMVDIHLSSENRSGAEESWRSAVRCFAAYGFRNDVTIFELIDSLRSVADVPGALLQRLERLNPLLVAVVTHTDGKSTKHAPNAALRLLAEHEPVAAVCVMVEDQLGSNDATSWISESAVETCVRAFRGKADPLLFACGASMLRYEVDAGDSAVRKASQIVEDIKATAGAQLTFREEFIQLLAARVEGDAEKCDGRAFELVRSSVVNSECRLARSSVAEATSEFSREDSTSLTVTSRRRVTDSPPPRGASVLASMAWVREVVHHYRDEELVSILANPIGYLCLELSQTGSPEVADSLIRFTARCFPEYGGTAGRALTQLAEGFERYGATSLAALSYVLAFTSTNGGGGWHIIGDEHVRHLFDRSLALCPDIARAVVAQEVARKASVGYAMGLVEAIVACVARIDVKEACDAWDAAFGVVAHRLPTIEGRNGWLPPFRATGLPDWTMDEGIIAAIISYSRHPEQDRRTAALLAFARAVTFRPDAVGKPLAHCLETTERAPLWAFHLLQVVWEAEPAPFEVTVACSRMLTRLGSSSWFGFRVLCDALLSRAGHPIVGCRVSPVIATAPVSPEVATKVWAFAGHERIEAVARFDPNFRERFARRFVHLVSASAAGERSSQRVELMAERDVDPSRWVPMVQYEQELLHQALQETVSGVRVPQNLVGPDRAEFEFALLSVVTSDLRTQIGYTASRCVRPLISRPAETAAGVGQLEHATSDEGNAGWVRFGIYEREYYWEERSSLAEPAEKITRVSGVHILGGTTVDAASPLGQAPRSTWGIEGKIHLVGLSWVIAPGPIVGLHFLSDAPLGHAPLLTLPEALIHRFKLRPRRWPSALVLEDKRGEAMACFRYWCVGSIRRHERPGRLEGCELMVHPELSKHIAGLDRSPLVNVTVIVRSRIVPHSRGW